MSWSRAMAASLAAALDRPAWWILALASFLVRGGLAVFILPIVILPTPAGLQNAFGAEITGFAFGSPSGSFITAVIVASIVVTVWLVAGGLLAAWADVALVSAAGIRVGREAGGSAGLAWRALSIRLASHLPLVVALVWGVARIVEAVYAEYLHPGDLASPLFLRIALRIPDVIAVIGLAWIAGEAAGGLAVRRLVLGRRSTIDALARGWFDLLARPTVVVTVIMTSAAFALVAVPLARGAGDAWGRLRALLGEGSDPRLVVLALAVFAAIWLAGLAAVGVIAAWRSAAWTFEVARRERDVLPQAGPEPEVPSAEVIDLLPDSLPVLEPVVTRHAGGVEPV